MRSRIALSLHEEIYIIQSLMRSKLILFIAVLLSVFFSGCSFFEAVSAPELLPEKKNTLSSLAGRYLIAIANSDLQGTTRMVLWDQYLENNKISAAQYSKVWVKVAGKWPAGKHPLQGLKVDNVRADDDSAKIFLIKDPELGKQPDPQRVTIELVWTGGGWMVSGDNLFSRDGFFTKFLEQANGA